MIPIAWRGVEQNFLDGLDIRIGEGPRYSSSTHVAIRDGCGDVCRDFEEARMAPWRGKLYGCGFKACAAFPIRRDKRIWGGLTVYASDPGILGEREYALLEETTNSISYVLSVIDDRAAHRRIENAFRESEQHFRSLFQTVSEIVTMNELVFGEDGNPIDYRITDCNPSFSRIYGIPRERAVDALASELYGTGHAPYLAEFSSVAVTGEPYSFETYFPPIGKYLQISVVAPAPGQFATISSDITFRKHAENALRESEERFRSTFEQAATGIAHVSLDGKFLRVNQRFCNLLGYSQEELSGMHFQDITFADDLPADLQKLKELIEGKVSTFTKEKRYLANRGRILWAQITVSLVHLPNGEPHYFIGVIQDIAQRKQAEDALRDSESRYRRLTQAVTDYVYSVQIRDGHPAETKHGAGCLSVTGYSEAEFESDHYLWLRMVVAEDRHVVLDQVEAILTNRDASPIEHRIARKDGTIRWVRNTPSAHRNAQGILLSYDGLVQDITERKIAEQQLREANAKLQTYAGQMEVLVKGRTAELEATNRELEAFSYSVSHDLRAPLRAIDGFARIFMEDYGSVLDDDGRRLLKVVESENRRMGRPIDDLLAFSRMGR
ncbi:MAG: PAS domain S-box protein, partial [Opitutaceae bacterium]